MSPYRAIFLVYPVAVIMLTILIKIVVKKRKPTNTLLLAFTYVLTNIAIYMLVEGVFYSHPYSSSARIKELFLDLNVRQWIDLLIVPNVFTFMYIGICQLFIWIFDHSWWNKLIIRQGKVYSKSS